MPRSASLADEYLDQYYFPNNPTAATQAGIHRYDRELEDYSRAALARQIKSLKAYERRFRPSMPRPCPSASAAIASCCCRASAAAC